MLSSDEINFLVYRYLQESGFVHAAFTFGYESLVLKSPKLAAHLNHVPAGALTALLQKGLLYVQVERQVHTSKQSETSLSDMSGIPELGNKIGDNISSERLWASVASSQSLRFSSWNVKHDKNRDADDDECSYYENAEPRPKRMKNPACSGTNAQEGPSMSTGRIGKQLDASPESDAALDAIGQSNINNATLLDSPTTRGEMQSSPLQMPCDASLSKPAPNGELGFLKPDLRDDVTALPGHTAEVFCCEWNPCNDMLATGSGDSTTRLWDLRDGKASPSAPSRILQESGHNTGDAQFALKNDRDVTTLAWSADGSMLATGCMDGIARLWTCEGKLTHLLSAHSESIFSLSFDEHGQNLLTGSYDRCVSVWEVDSGLLKAKFEAHTAQVLDVDWRRGSHFSYDAFTEKKNARGSYSYFASCSTDRTIAICAIDPMERAPSPKRYDLANLDSYALFPDCGASDSSLPVKEKNALSSDYFPIEILKGHTDEVNSVRWDPSGRVLASCSDDKSVLLWKFGMSTPFCAFRDHNEEIYTVRWSPTGPGTRHPSAPVRLASASFDATVKLWDVEAASCTHTLHANDKKVYTVAFSPSGDLVASGSLGGQVNIWNVNSGVLLKSFVVQHTGASELATPRCHLSDADVSRSNISGADIFEVAWNSSGTMLAAASTSAVSVIELRTMDSRAYA